MALFEIGYGCGSMSLSVPDKNLAGVLLPNVVSPCGDEEGEVRRALQNPIGTRRLRDIVRAGEKIVIVTSDVTRPMPTGRVMPALLEELRAAGVADGDLTLVFALGSHRKHTEEEMIRLAGKEVYGRIRCIDSNGEDCVRLGVTRRGTPVDIFTPVVQADRRICLGNIEFHYFAGYSGGCKAIMPGVSTREAIQANHSMMIKDEACAGSLDRNPLRQDLEEAAQLCGVDFILNVVLDEHKKIRRAVAGDVILAHRAGCAFLDGMYGVKIEEPADIVVVSQGGAPKDMNLYQTQKALDNAKHAVKEGGVVILAGACPEGFGEAVFEEWLREAGRPKELIDRIQREFKLGGHKAAAIAMVLEKSEIFMVSDMDSDTVKGIFMRPFKTVQEAFDAALTQLGQGARVLVMPYGGSTLPKR